VKIEAAGRPLSSIMRLKYNLKTFQDFEQERNHDYHYQIDEKTSMTPPDYLDYIILYII